MPINQGYTAIQRAVVECAYAGCETIWITLSYGQEPLIREVLGDFVEDPVWFHRSAEKFPKENRKQIPIFYVPVHTKDAGRRDCYSWGIINSAMAAYYTSKKISDWLLPSKYYVAHPYGVYDPSCLREHRKQISKIDTPFYLSYNNKTVSDSMYLGFTFDTQSFVRIRKQFRELESQERKNNPRPARFFKLGAIFNILNPEFVENSKVVELDKYSDISFWNGYVDYMSTAYVEKPKLKILKEGKKEVALPPIICYSDTNKKD